MNVRLQDGTIIRNVPDSMSRAEFVKHALRNGVSQQQLGIQPDIVPVGERIRHAATTAADVGLGGLAASAEAISAPIRAMAQTAQDAKNRLATALEMQLGARPGTMAEAGAEAVGAGLQAVNTGAQFVAQPFTVPLSLAHGAMQSGQRAGVPGMAAAEQVVALPEHLAAGVLGERPQGRIAGPMWDINNLLFQGLLFGGGHRGYSSLRGRALPYTTAGEVNPGYVRPTPTAAEMAHLRGFELPRSNRFVVYPGGTMVDLASGIPMARQPALSIPWGIPVESRPKLLMAGDLPAQKGVREVAPAPKPVEPAKPVRNWDALYDDLTASLDAFSPARETGRRNYELDDMAQRFVEFAQQDNSGRSLAELVKEFSLTDEANSSQIKKLKAAVSEVEPSPAKQAEPAKPAKKPVQPTEAEILADWEKSQEAAALREAARPVEPVAAAPAAKQPWDETPFRRLADLQRGEPEAVMLEVQRANGGGVLNPVVEHGGDLLHRMNEVGPRNDFGYENVANKIDVVLRALNDKYGFEKEFAENLASNAKYDDVPLVEYTAKVNAALSKYADAHAALPTFNRVQRLAQDAAVAVGRQQWDVARAKFGEIQGILKKGKENWVKEASLEAKPTPAPVQLPVKAVKSGKAVSEGPGAAAASEFARPMSEGKLPKLEQSKIVTEEQLETASRALPDLLSQGHFSDDVKFVVSKGEKADPRIVINERLIQEARQLVKDAFEKADRLAREAAQQADPESIAAANLARDHAKQALNVFRESYRSWHDVGMALQRAHQELALSSQTYRLMREIKPKLPILDQLWKDVQARKGAAAARDLLAYLRANLFTIGSWTLDFSTNALRGVVELPASAAYDLANIATGKPSAKFIGTLQAIRRNARNAAPGERWRLDPRIEQGLGTTVGGEYIGQTKDVMTSRLKGRVAGIPLNADYVLGGPVRAKRAMDNFFGRVGATAELYHQATIRARDAGLRGRNASDFVDNFVRNPDEAAIEAAVKAGNEWKFNRPLSKVEERFANNWAVQTFADAYPRWGLQFARWAGEMLGANPVFLRAVKGKATAAEVAEAVVQAASGWGAVYLVNQMLYDQVDFNTMEYRDEHGNRTRLSNRTPLPDALFLAAVIRGDWEKAKAAIPQLSLPLARLAGGEPGGILAPFIDAASGSVRGKYTSEIVAQEFAKMANDALPGKSVMGAIRSLYDPTVRTGIGSPYPGVSSFLPTRINPTTGEALAPHQMIPGIPLQLPTAGGTPIPGAIRVLNKVEQALLDHGLMLNRPRRTPILMLPAEDVPKELRREYEELAGKFVNRNVTYLLDYKSRSTGKVFGSIPFEKRRELLQQQLSLARRQALLTLAKKYNKPTGRPVIPPLAVQRLPVNQSP